jgi:hypothetical protein
MEQKKQASASKKPSSASAVSTSKYQHPPSEVGKRGKETALQTAANDAEPTQRKFDPPKGKQSFWDHNRKYHWQSSEVFPFTRTYQYYTEKEYRDQFVFEPATKRIKWDADNDGSKRDDEPTSIYGFTTRYDWTEDLDPITREEIDSEMADWPQWPYDRYSWRELSDIRCSRGYFCWTDPRLVAVMKKKERQFRRLRRTFERAFQKTMYNRYAPESKVKGFIAQVVELSWDLPPQPYAQYACHHLWMKPNSVVEWENYLRQKERRALRQQRREDKDIDRWLGIIVQKLIDNNIILPRDK